MEKASSSSGHLDHTLTDLFWGLNPSLSHNEGLHLSKSLIRIYFKYCSKLSKLPHHFFSFQILQNYEFFEQAIETWFTATDIGRFRAETASSGQDSALSAAMSQLLKRLLTHLRFPLKLPNSRLFQNLRTRIQEDVGIQHQPTSFIIRT